MKIYILLRHDYNEYEDLFYTYEDCVNIKGLENFCIRNNLTFDLNQMKLYDYAHFERYQVIGKDI